MKLKAMMSFLVVALLSAFIVAPMSVEAAKGEDTGALNRKVTGTVTGGGTFDGKVKITRFYLEGNKVMAEGALKGAVTREGKVTDFKWEKFTAPVNSVNGVDLTNVQPRPATTASTGASAFQVGTFQVGCPILNLDLGPLDLNLLGLQIDLSAISLDITAIPGGGLLGDLLCAVANLLSGGIFLNLLGQLVDLLNDILGALG